ncbi:hypothetical protein C1631_023820, partial [Chryseobacterium phosphatilyticum]
MIQSANTHGSLAGSLPCGSIPALITPMSSDGRIDWSAYRRLIDWHVESGTDAIVAV